LPKKTDPNCGQVELRSCFTVGGVPYVQRHRSARGRIGRSACVTPV
jgi:hypothetical protein